MKQLFSAVEYSGIIRPLISFQLHAMAFALPFILEAIWSLEFKNLGKSGSARLPRGMKLGNTLNDSSKCNYSVSYSIRDQ